jgi:hypothetical protein
MGVLHERRSQVGEAANVALRGSLNGEASRNVHELLEVCERILRRRRILKM